MSLAKKLLHVRLSWRAIVTLWREELSFRIQTVCAVVILLASWALKISGVELVIVILTIGAVFAVEALNTALEELCDHVTLDRHPQIGKIKDLGSGASLLIGIAAFVVGISIFVPRFSAFL